MKTLMINASPKKKMSVSAYFLSVLKFFTFGGVTKENLRNKGDHARLLGALDGADNVVFCLPMYVDGVPSHVLAFMKEAEAYCREKGLKVNVYVISNGGFIEGNQNRVLMQIFENFCNRSGLNWCGGIGIGGGVMLNVMRVMFFVYIGLFVLNMIMGNPVKDNLIELAKGLGTVLFFNLGVFGLSATMGAAVRKGRSFGVKFTRALMPSFIFIIVADIFFILISLLKGGVFRGWLSKKVPTNEQ
jgi:hypothetical protein